MICSHLGRRKKTQLVYSLLLGLYTVLQELYNFQCSSIKTEHFKIPEKQKKLQQSVELYTPEQEVNNSEFLKATKLDYA